MKRIGGRGKKKQENIALERIKKLMELAGEESRKNNLGQADQLVIKARKISTRTKTCIPRELKHKFCKHCYSYLKPGTTSRTKTNSTEKRVEVTCLKCSKKMFYSTKKNLTVKSLEHKFNMHV